MRLVGLGKGVSKIGAIMGDRSNTDGSGGLWVVGRIRLKWPLGMVGW